MILKVENINISWVGLKKEINSLIDFANSYDDKLTIKRLESIIADSSN